LKEITMPLPPSGKTVWPPVQFHEPFADMDVWRAWYSGDTSHLALVYGGPGAYTQNELARSFFDLNRPSQFRGGIVGGLARMFWGEPITPGQPAAKLHVPIAADIAELSANLLWSDIPTVTVDADSTEGSSALVGTQDQIKRYLDDCGHSTLREAAEMAAALSGVYVRVVWDTSLRPRPWMDVLSPDAVVPEWRWGMLAAATVWRELEPLHDSTEVWRLLERHEPGSIEYGLYRGDADTLGMLMALDDHPETQELVGRVNEQSIVETGIKRLLVTYMPNVGPNRCWDHLPDAKPFGRSDFAGIEPLMGSLDEAWTSWLRDLRLGKARLVVPQSMLETDGPGSGGMFDLDREVLLELNMLDDGAGAAAIKDVQFAIRVEEHERTCAALRGQILSSAGYSAQSFGDEGNVAVTATEVAAREKQSLTTRGLKLLYQRPALLEILTTMLWVDAVNCGAKDVDPTVELTASWPQAVQPDPEATARTLSFLETAGAISTWMKVKTLHPEWDDDEVAEEVARIRDDKAAASPIPAGDPFGTAGGQGDGQDGEDPEYGEGEPADGGEPQDGQEPDAKPGQQKAA
jgi:A118 family predicted phage portal protein